MAQAKTGADVRRKNKIRRSGEDWVIDSIVAIVMIIVFITTVYPFYYCIVISFNQGIDASLGGIFLWPRQFTFDNYKEVFKDSQLMTSYGMTILRTIVGTMGALFFTGLVAFALSHKNLMFRNAYMTMMIIAMYVSGGLIPFYMMLRFLKLLNTFWVYVVPNLFGIWNCILMINFFRAIPESLEESAKLDGANDLTIFFRIIVPVSMPILATIALYVGVYHWNDWYSTSFFAQQNRSLRTMAYMLRELITRANLTSIAAKFGSDVSSLQREGTMASASYTAETLRMSTMIVVVVPIMCVYPFLQKYFVKGVMVGSVKG